MVSARISNAFAEALECTHGWSIQPSLQQFFRKKSTLYSKSYDFARLPLTLSFFDVSRLVPLDALKSTTTIHTSNYHFGLLILNCSYMELHSAKLPIRASKRALFRFMGPGDDRAEDFLSAKIWLNNFTSVSECSNGIKIRGKLE